LANEVHLLERHSVSDLAAELNTLNTNLAANVEQLQQLYRQRDFELRQRYHAQAFLDFDGPPRRAPHGNLEPDSSGS